MDEKIATPPFREAIKVYAPLTLFAMALIFHFKWNVLKTLGLLALCGLLLGQLR